MLRMEAKEKLYGEARYDWGVVGLTEGCSGCFVVETLKLGTAKSGGG